MNGFTKLPKDLGIIPLNVEEYFTYLYLPVKLAHSNVNPYPEKRLEVFNPLIGKACCDFIGDFGLDRYVRSYVYLTTQHQYQPPGSGFNRPGWHTDGFGTDDVTYIWSNTQPTIFNSGPFKLSKDDVVSMSEMEEQADPLNNYTYPNDTLLRIDQHTVHKVAPYEQGNRVFFKLSISEDIYNLKGNSINHRLKDIRPDKYNWQYVDRSLTRNVPQPIIKS